VGGLVPVVRQVKLGQGRRGQDGEDGDAAERLAGAFRTAGLPVVFVTFDPELSPSGRTHLGGRMATDEHFIRPLPSLEPTAGDLTIAKGGWSAFSDPDLAGALRSRGVGQVIIVGVATTFGVESTARDAYDAGFHGVVVTDAVTDMSTDSQDQAFSRAVSPMRSRAFNIPGPVRAPPQVRGTLPGERPIP
jgi:nicotinamidase-related amidase